MCTFAFLPFYRSRLSKIKNLTKAPADMDLIIAKHLLILSEIKKKLLFDNYQLLIKIFL